MLTNADRKSWGPLAEAGSWVASLIPQGARVLEIGPGSVPFARATDFVDWVAGGRVVSCDLNRQRLPFADQAFDFVYCRHVLEDLYNPFQVCEEMSRVARAGYIETPSPLAEFCRGIDGGSPAWRGYHHHRYFAWERQGVLTFLGKYPLVEHLEVGNEASVDKMLRDDAFLWNSYHAWNGEIRWTHLQHDVDYRLCEGYGPMVASAMSEGVASARAYKRRFGSE